MSKRTNRPARQFGVYYMHDTRAINWQRFSSRAGYTNSLLGAIGMACYHIGRDDYYPKAVIVDRFQQKIVRVIHRTGSGISIVERD